MPGAEYDYQREKWDRKEIEKLRQSMQACQRALHGQEAVKYQGLSPARAMRAYLLYQHFENDLSGDCYVHNVRAFGGQRGTDLPYLGRSASAEELAPLSTAIDEKRAFLRSSPTEEALLARRKRELEIKLEELDASLTSTFQNWQKEDGVR